MYESVRLRESIFHTIGQSAADLESQGKASEYALRKRLHELERSLERTGMAKETSKIFPLQINASSFLFLFTSCRQKKKFLVMKMILIV